MLAGEGQARQRFEKVSYQVNAIVDLCCESPRFIAEISCDQIHGAADELNQDDVDAIVQVGTNVQFRREV